MIKEVEIVKKLGLTTYILNLIKIIRLYRRINNF